MCRSERGACLLWRVHVLQLDVTMVRTMSNQIGRHLVKPGYAVEVDAGGGPVWVGLVRAPCVTLAEPLFVLGVA